MPKIAYSEAERERVRKELITTGLELMAKQGIQHTTIEQIYLRVGISRTFFYSFFPAKEDLVVQAFYYQQPQMLARAGADGRPRARLAGGGRKVPPPCLLWGAGPLRDHEHRGAAGARQMSVGG